MFSVIDTALINFAQWAIKLCELYTALPRRIVFFTFFAICIFLNIAFIVIVFILTMKTFTVDFVILYRTLGHYSSEAVDSIVFTVTLFTGTASMSILASRSLRNQLKFYSSKNEGTLPQAIVQRKKIRGIYTLGFISTLMIIPCIGVLYEPKDIATFLTVYFLVFCIYGYFFCSIAIEYLLCTTSLPPGEKERKKQEREMSNFGVQGTAG